MDVAYTNSESSRTDARDTEQEWIAKYRAALEANQALRFGRPKSGPLATALNWIWQDPTLNGDAIHENGVGAATHCSEPVSESGGLSDPSNSAKKQSPGNVPGLQNDEQPTTPGMRAKKAS